MVCRVLFILLLFCCPQVQAQVSAAKQQYRVGILAFQPKSVTAQKWAVLGRTLSESCADLDFAIVPMSAQQLEEAIQQRAIDFVLTNPSQYIRFHHLYGLTAPLATVVRGRQGQPLHAFGGSIFTLATNQQVNSLQDLKGRQVAIPFATAFGAFQAQQYELYLKDFSLLRPEQLVITGLPHDNMVKAVLDGRAEVGFARAGTLERMARQGKIELSHFKVINQQSSAYPVRLSTHIYPEWPIAALAHVHPNDLSKVLAALLQQPPDSTDPLPFNVLGFRLPADYQPVETLMRAIRAVPFDQSPDVRPEDLWHLYRWQIIAALAALAIIAVLAFRLLLSHRQLQLSRQHLQASMERLELALEGGKLGTWDWQIDSGDVLFCDRWAAILGYEMREIEPNYSTWETLLHPGDKQEAMELVEEHLAGKTPLLYSEHRLRHKDGHWVWTLSIGRVCERDEDGKPRRAVGVQMDISRQKELEQELATAMEKAQAANTSKSAFLANMSHELRTPLNAILGYSQLYNADNTLPASLQSAMVTIRQAGEHLLLLINDILDLSKVEAGKMELAPNRCLLRQFLQSVADIIAVRAQAKNLAFSCHFQEGLPELVLLDELRLRQVLLNLLSNAVKFTRQGSCSLVVQQRRTGEGGKVELSFAVEDSGPGIEVDRQQEVFEPFLQSGDYLQHGEGSGLGLSISRKLVRLMGGDLLLESPLLRPEEKGGGPGSRFSFTIVVDTVAQPEAQPLKSEQVGYCGKAGRAVSKRVLIVDDDAANRAVLRDTLQAIGFVAVTVETGLLARQYCEQFQPDLVLMDLRMPGIDGLATTDQLKQHPEFREIPVLAMTASATDQQGVALQCEQHGLSGLLFKPFALHALLEKVAELLDLQLLYGADLKQPDSKPLLYPPAQELETLAHFCQIGDFGGLAAMADSLTTKDDGLYAPFAAKLQALADDFDMAAIEKMVARAGEEDRSF